MVSQINDTTNEFIVSHLYHIFVVDVNGVQLERVQVPGRFITRLLRPCCYLDSL
jgi:hypothetical protein